MFNAGFYSLQQIQGTEKEFNKCLSHKEMEESRFYVIQRLIDDSAPKTWTGSMAKNGHLLSWNKVYIKRATEFMKKMCHFFIKMPEIPPDINTWYIYNTFSFEWILDSICYWLPFSMFGRPEGLSGDRLHRMLRPSSFPRQHMPNMLHLEGNNFGSSK